MKKPAIILLVLLTTMVVFTGCGKKKEKNKLDIEVNSSKDVIKDQEVDGLKLTNTSLTKVNNNWSLVTEVSNKTGSDYYLDEFTITIKDKDNNVLATLPGYVGESIPNGESRVITSNTIRDLSKATKIDYEVKK